MADKRPPEPDDVADLDPQSDAEWTALRAEAHRMLDDVLDYVRGVRGRPVWRAMPDAVRGSFSSPMPREGADLAEAYAELRENVVPYATGNVHPRFMGWVHGGGNVFGVLGDMLAAGLNANLGGRNHAPIELERQVVRWAAELFGFPSNAGGLLVTGSSIANFIAVVVARTAAAGPEVRARGVAGRGLVAYTSAAAHGCVARAMDMAGLGTDALRVLPVGADFRIDVSALAAAIERDRREGLTPFLVVGTAGTVDTGAIDDLPALSALCKTHALWFHIDGAFGALAMLAPSLRPLLAGLESADSIAFDFHKWGQVPYDAGCIVVRDRDAQLRAFAADAAYLRRGRRGLAAGDVWPFDLGPDLSRGFRALKVWLTIKALGADRLGAAIEHTCALARRLAARVDGEPELERVAPVALNIVCFRYRFDHESDWNNAELVADLQESGVAAPSTTTIGGRVVVRCAIVNHRTRAADVDALVDAVLARGRERAGGGR